MALELGKAASLTARTAPYGLLRLGIWAAVGLCAVACLALLGIVGSVFGMGAFWVSLALLVLVGGLLGVWNLIAFHVDILPKSGHIALITELVNQGLPPGGLSQFEWCRQQQMMRFKEDGEFRLFRFLVKRAMREVHENLLNVHTHSPVPGMEGTERSLGWIVGLALNYLGELVLAYTYRGNEVNAFQSARRGILLYCANWERLFREAFQLVLLGYVVGVLAAAIAAVPLGLVALLLPAEWVVARFILFCIALFVGLGVKWVVFDPLAYTALVMHFFEESEKHPLQEGELDELEESLEEESESYVRILARASNRTV